MEYEQLAQELLDLFLTHLKDPTPVTPAESLRGEPFVLHYLMAHRQGVHPREISSQMSVSSARIAALLGRMEEKGLISRQGDPKDNRQVIVTLLADGKAIAEQLHAKALRQTASLLEALGPEDAREYVRLQHKLMDARRQTAAETP